MSETMGAIIVGVIAFAVVIGIIALAARIYRRGAERQQRILRAAFAAAFIISVIQAAGSDGGYAAAFPVLFAGWALIICLVWLAVAKIRGRRDTQG